jgi:hypothetical protein
MALKDIKARIQSQVKLADPGGNVYTFRRYLTAEADQAAFIGPDGRFHFWHIYREMTALTDMVVNQGFVQQDDTLVIEGFYGVKDADDSEEAFDLIVDAVLQGVNLDRRPTVAGGTKLAGTVQTAGTPALRKMDFHLYGASAALCHHVEIVMKVTPRYLQ